MTLQNILSKAQKTQKIINLGICGLGKYKGTRYFFKNNFVIEIGTGNPVRSNTFNYKRSTTNTTLTVKQGKTYLLYLRGPDFDKSIDQIKSAMKINKK